MRARVVSRRTLLKAAAGAGALAGLGPWIVRDARSSSGEVRIMTWAGYDFKAILAAFEKATGIKPVVTEFPDQDAMLAQMRAGGTGGFDVAEPTADRVPNWVEQGVLQPIDESKVALGTIEPSFLGGDAGATAVVGGKRYGLPSVWGSEALCHHTKQAPLKYGQASFGDLWRPEFAGKVTVRAHSGLVGIGLWLEGAGKLPHPMRESFKDQAKMVANYDVIVKTAIEKRKSVLQFWSNENEAQGAFRTNGAVIGQNWDTSAAALVKEKLPIGYLAPKEGALSWLQNWTVPKGAKNLAQAQAWLTWIVSADGAGKWAAAYGANPVAKNAVVAEDQKRFMADSFPGDALAKLWWWPAQPSWFVSKRNEYADRFKSA
jgi:spermidine/putrescine transport system substrate-binding protein